MQVVTLPPRINHKKLFRLYREERHAVPPPRRPQAGNWGQGANRGAAGPERTLVAQLRIGSAHRWPKIPDPGRRLHSRVTGAFGRHLALGRPGGARAGSADG